MSEIVEYVAQAKAVRMITGAEDPFTVCFGPAKPCLDAYLQLREPLAAIDKYRRQGVTIFEPERAAEICGILPNEDLLVASCHLFQSAERDAAPEGWVHVALGLWLESMPRTEGVSDAYPCSIVDGMYQDPEVWGSYGPGFSHAVIVRVIREARLLNTLPNPGKILAMCSRHRSQFAQFADDSNRLVQLLDFAQRLELVVQPSFDPDSDIPF